MIKAGDHEYKLLLLDTNILREIALNNDDIQKRFLDKFFKKSNRYAPCFSIYNVIELKPYKDIFEKFLAFFGVIPCVVLYPYKAFLEEEYEAYIQRRKVVLDNRLINAFSMLGSTDSHNIRKFFNTMWENEKFYVTTKREVEGLSEVAVEWNKQREESKCLLKSMGLQENIINDKFYKSQEKETVIKDMKVHDIFLDNNVDIRRFPGIRIMEYSHFSRVYMTKKKILKNDVMDVKISSVLPYVDAVITEKFQAEVYRKAKSFIKEIKHIEIFKLKDI